MKEKPAKPRKRHILIVDDNVELAQSYKDILEAGDYTASIAPNGVVGLKQVLNQPVDAVICDLKMPQLEGDKFYVTVERVKPELLRRFIFISGETNTEKFQAFLRKVEAPVYTKPVAIEKIIKTLESFWARGG